MNGTEIINCSLEHSVLPRVAGCRINVFNLHAGVREIVAAAKAKRVFTVFTINLDHLVKLRRNELFREAYRAADFVSIDGAPVAWLARRQNQSVERATGADMLLPLVAEAADGHLPIFLLGTSPEVLENAVAKLKDFTGGKVDISDILSPSAHFDPRGPEASAAIDRIRRSSARLCFVALGAPKQEIFAEYARQSGLSCGLICVGAAIDFLVGTQIRSPKLFRQAGIEWIWRLAQDPRRLGKRYFDCAVLFARMLWLEYIGYGGRT